MTISGFTLMMAATLVDPQKALPPPIAIEPIVFAGDVFDVTGAGELDLGDIDPVLAPYFRIFRERPLTAEIELDLIVDAAGIVVNCRSTPDEGLAEAGAALCAHAKAVGRFRTHPYMVLDYTRANYHTSVGLSFATADGEPLFSLSTSSFPNLEDRPIIFGDGAIPVEGQRLRAQDVTIAPMDYPLRALRNEVTGRVAVAITFDAEGKAASCRPIRSSFTARLAYETCKAAQRAVRLKQPPDARPYVLAIYWALD